MPFNRPTPSRKPQSKLSDGLGAYVQAEKMVQIALVLPCAVLIGWGGGAWLDIHLHQSWITLAGIVLGSVAGMLSAIRLAMAAAGGPKVENETGNEIEPGSSGKEP